MLKRLFRLYDSTAHVTQSTHAESAREALSNLDIDPDTVYVESASGSKVLLMYENRKLTLTDLGYV